MNKSFLEASKELLRLIAMSVVGFFLSDLVVANLVEYFLGAQLDPFAKLQITALFTAVLRTVDKYLHELGKEVDNSTLKKGLTFGL